MGILYIETCGDCFLPRRKCSCTACETPPWGGPRPNPPAPPGGFPLDEVLRRLAQLEREVLALRSEITGLGPIIETILEFINLEQGRNEAFREFFESIEGEQVTVVTTFDVVEGIVETAGVDVVVIVTPNNDIVIIPYTSIITASSDEGAVI